MPARLNHPTPLPVQRSLRTLGDHASAWRKLRGLTQPQLAERAGISPQTVRNLEKGRSVSVENLLRISRALGLLDQLAEAIDPLNSDLGRLRADERLPQRVRPRRLTGGQP
ncbi:MAG: helix-turn-helix transcriptional regulator [Solirubrobacteraceae bacterium]